MIDLKHDSYLATIDSQGAWVTSYSSADTPILYPKSDIESILGGVKTRGGCHICLPNFGPGGDSTQPQHGYGRLLTWNLVTHHQSEAILRLEPSVETDYCNVILRYSLGDDGLAIDLTVTNSGSESIRLAPGFHPYFAIDTKQAVYLNQAKVNLSEYSDATFVKAHSMELENGDTRIRLSAVGMTLWALWTDQLAEYFCIEPTSAGFAFESDAAPDQLLEPGGTKQYQLTITAY